MNGCLHTMYFTSAEIHPGTDKQVSMNPLICNDYSDDLWCYDL